MIRPKAFFPVVVTASLAECRSFFTGVFGFEPVFDSDWYLHLVHENGAQLGFMVPQHPSQPDYLQSSFAGTGLVYSFEVEDADQSLERATAAGARVILPLKSEEWGQRHFMIAGPGGIVVDVVQNLNPSFDV